jgi:hypothetical protein
MAMFAPIPLPGIDNDPFKDVMDYFETIQKRKALQQEAANTLAEKQKEFGITNQLEREKLAQVNSLKPLQMELLRAKIAEIQNGQNGGKKLTAQERSQKMKLLEAGRAVQGLASRGNKLSSLLEENPNLTGWGPGVKTLLKKPGEKLGSFNSTAGGIQADIARLGGQRGGAQLIKWAKSIKPNEWNDVETNTGMVNSLLENAKSDYGDIKNEYEDLTGESYPIQFPERQTGNNPPGTTKMYKNGNEYHIPNEEVAGAKVSGYSNEK